MKHVTHESHRGRLVGVLLCELNSQFKGPVLEGGVMGPKDDRVPDHDVVIGGRTTDASWGVLLQSTTISLAPSRIDHCTANYIITDLLKSRIRRRRAGVDIVFN